MDRLQNIESRIEEANIFILLEYLKELAVYENDSRMMRDNEVFIVGLIERVQERIVLGQIA